MRLDWSTCQCCGQPAQQRQIWTKKYHPTWDGVQSPRLYETERPTPLYPDLCDICFRDIVTYGEEGWLEYERRSQEFRQNFRVVGFVPIIEPTAEAIAYEI